MHNFCKHNLVHSRRLGRRAHQSFVLSCQVFVSGLEGEEEVGHLVSSSPLLPSQGSFPYLSAYQETYLLVPLTF